MFTGFEGLPWLKVKYNQGEEAFSMRAHSHREISIGFIKEGRTVFTVGGQNFILQPSDLVLIPPDTIHLCSPEDPAAYSFFMLYFETEWWNRTAAVSAGCCEAAAQPAYPEFLRIFHGIENNDLGSIDLAVLLEQAVRKLTELNPGIDSSDADRGELDRIHQLIKNEPEMPMDIESLADRAGMSKFSFIRKYAKKYGLTPHADVVNMRIQRAILLFEGGMKLADIAAECGFTDQSHFNNQFKLYTGISPAEYRKAVGG